MAAAIGCKTVASFRARACQLGIFHDQPADVVAEVAA
jgi:hypothetical protein